MDLRQLRQFVTVAEEKSFRKAAERLCMAQPPLSVAIRKLEQDIGHALFSRSTQGASLTAAGLAAYNVAKRCLRLADEISPAAHAAAEGESGLLGIGFVGSVTYGLMPQLVKALSERYPLISVELREGSNRELMALLLNHEVDVAFVRLPVARPQGVDFHLIEKDVMCAALPSGHPMLRQKTVSVHDLVKEPLIGYSPTRASALHIALMQVFQQAGVAPVIAQEAVQVQTLIGLVEKGMGVALVPSVFAKFPVRTLGYRQIHDMPPSAAIGIALAVRPGHMPVVQRFLEVAASVQGLPPLVAAQQDMQVPATPEDTGS